MTECKNLIQTINTKYSSLSEKHKSIIDLLISGIVSAAFLLAVYMRVGIFYESNDDKYITDILAGILSVKPDAHVVYGNYLLMLPLKLLYSITTKIPWYGGFLILLHFFVYLAIFYCVLSGFKKWGEKIVSLGVTMIIIFAHMYCVGEIQYTSTAAYLAVAGYVCLICKQEKGKVFFFLFELIAYLLRSKAMLMIQPFGMAVVLGILLMQDEDNKKKIIRLLQYASLLLFVFAIGFLGNVIGYSGDDWKDYKRYNDARTILFDIYEIPPYEEAKEVLDKYGVTQSEYKAFEEYCVLEWDLSTECVEELAELVVKNNPKSFEISKIWQMIRETFSSNFLWGMNFLRILLIGIIAAWIVCSRRWKLVVPVLCLSGVSLLIWGYLLWQGRLPERVSVPLVFAEVILLALLLMTDYQRSEKKIFFKVLIVVACVIFSKKAYSTGMREYYYVNMVNKDQGIYVQGMYDIQEYCGRNLNNKYLLDAYCMCFYRGDALNTRLYQQENSMITGGWFSNTPVVREKLELYLGDADIENIRLIVFASEEDKYASIKYFEEKWDCVAVEEECFTVSHGGNYRVYAFKKGNE